METWRNTNRHESLADYCRRNHVQRLSLFGSCLSGEAHAGSDLDLLVEFKSQAQVGLFQMAQMEIDLTEMLGRKVDLRTAQELSRYFREQVKAEAEVMYAEK